jgi:hypothetical protein
MYFEGKGIEKHSMTFFNLSLNRLLSFLPEELKLNLQKQKKTGKSNKSFIQMFDVLNLEKGFFNIQRLHFLLSQDVVSLMVA